MYLGCWLLYSNADTKDLWSVANSANMTLWGRNWIPTGTVYIRLAPMHVNLVHYLLSTVTQPLICICLILRACLSHRCVCLFLLRSLSQGTMRDVLTADCPGPGYPSFPMDTHVSYRNHVLSRPTHLSKHKNGFSLPPSASRVSTALWTS
jgi:hypothetical protein